MPAEPNSRPLSLISQGLAGATAPLAPPVNTELTPPGAVRVWQPPLSRAVKEGQHHRALDKIGILLNSQPAAMPPLWPFLAALIPCKI